MRRERLFCCLSSLNIEYYDEWAKNEQFIPDVMEFLDNVLQYFIDHAPDHIERARYSALRKNQLASGSRFSCLPSVQKIPLESVLAKGLSITKYLAIFIMNARERENKILSELRGACRIKDAGGEGRFFSLDGYLPRILAQV